MKNQNETKQNQNDTIGALMFGGLIRSCILKDIERLKGMRSAWGKGLKVYMSEFIEDMSMGTFQELTQKANFKDFETLLLNGAKNWHDYSWGGCSLIYNEDIAKRLCNPSELKKTKDGQNRPNSHEDWLDTQKRALYQACRKLYFVMFELSNMDMQTRKKYLQAV